MASITLKDLMYFKISGAIENTVFSNVKLDKEIPDSMIHFLKTTKNNDDGYIRHDNKIWKYFKTISPIFPDKFYKNFNENNVDTARINFYVMYAFTTILKFYFPNVFHGITVSEDFLESRYFNKYENLQHNNVYTDFEIVYIDSVILPFVSEMGKYCHVLVIFDDSRSTEDFSEMKSKIQMTSYETDSLYPTTNKIPIIESCIDVKFLSTINDSKICRYKILEYPTYLHTIKEWIFVKIDNAHKYIKNERYEHFSSMDPKIPQINFSRINELNTIHIISANEKDSLDIYVKISKDFDEIIIFTISDE